MLVAGRPPKDVCSNFAARAQESWRREEGLIWARRALELDPSNDAAAINLASIVVRSRDVDSDQVREVLHACAPAVRREASRHPEYAWTFLWGGDLAAALVQTARGALDAA